MTAPAFRATRGDSLTWQFGVAENLTGWTPRWTVKPRSGFADVLDTAAVLSATTGSGLTTTALVPVTFVDTGDLVMLSDGSSLGTGDEVVFNTVVTTTGIVTGTTYYVINRTTTSFQVAASAGGTALTLTTNGTGTLLRTHFDLVIAASATTVLDPGVYVWDLQLSNGANVRTVEWDDDGTTVGTLTIEADVTRTTP